MHLCVQLKSDQLQLQSCKWGLMCTGGANGSKTKSPLHSNLHGQSIETEEHCALDQLNVAGQTE